MKKEQKWNIFLVKIKDKDDERLTQHVIIDLNWQLVWNIENVKWNIVSCSIFKNIDASIWHRYIAIPSVDKAVKFNGQPLSANCLYLQMEVGEGEWTIHAQRCYSRKEEMFSALFNVKMNTAQWLVRFLHAGKEIVHMRRSVVRVAKKMNLSNKQHICSEFCVRLNIEVMEHGSCSLDLASTSKKALRPAVHLSRNMRKWARNAKNEKCITGYFASLFSRFALLFSFFTIRARVGIRAKTQRISRFIFSRH